jgi:hypothetical protein
VASRTAALNFGVLKRPLVRIPVTVLATSVRQSFVLHCHLSGTRAVAFFTSDGLVRSCQWILGPEMAEAGRGLPRVLGMTLYAFDTELATVGVGMATGAILIEAKKALVQILDLDLGSGVRGNLRRRMASLALELFMFPRQLESS